MIKLLANTFTLYLLSAVALSFWILAIAGGYHNWSFVPYWDMWDSYLGFFVKATTGDWQAWWTQHNEHRIVLGKVLFWIDLIWFRGEGWFLLTLNYLFALLLCVAAAVAQRQVYQNDNRLVIIFTTIWLISWAQHENLTWAFQGPLFLSTLLPFFALLSAYKSSRAGRHSRSFFAIACSVGLLSVVTMANGLLILPLMAIYATLIGLGWKRILSLVALFILASVAFFWDYTFPVHHGSIVTALAENPSGVGRYVFLFVGSPFFHILGGSFHARVAAEIAGATLISLAAYYLWAFLRTPKQSALQLGMLSFILYVGGAAFAAAGGRLQFGLDQALSSRYTTLALMAWVALSVCVAPTVNRLAHHYPWALSCALLGLSFAMLPLQLKALEPRDGVLFEREVAGLALELQVRDQHQIAHIYPSADTLADTIEVAASHDFSLFGHPLLQNVRERIGQRGFQLLQNRRACEGSVDALEPIAGESSYWRIRGWLQDTAQRNEPRSLWILAYDGTIIGYALLKTSRPALSIRSVNTVNRQHFSGYVLVGFRSVPGKLLSVGGDCKVPYQPK